MYNAMYSIPVLITLLNMVSSIIDIEKWQNHGLFFSLSKVIFQERVY